MHTVLPAAKKLNQQTGKNDYKNDFMINLHESYVAELGFELATPGSSVRHATVCSMEPGSKYWDRQAETSSLEPNQITQNAVCHSSSCHSDISSGSEIDLFKFYDKYGPYSRFSLSRLCLSRITAYLEVKICPCFNMEI